MAHKIQTGNNGEIILDIKKIKDIVCLQISKGNSTEKNNILTFNREQTIQLNAIIQGIDAGNLILKEYGNVQVGNQIFKVCVSAFRGIKSFQIRERLISNTYSGYGKQWVTLPTYKIKELQGHMSGIVQEFSISTFINKLDI